MSFSKPTYGDLVTGLKKFLHLFSGGASDGLSADPTVIYDKDGTPAPSGSASDPLRVAGAGSAGTDYSINAAVLPNVGANFPASGPYASFVLLKTIAANPSRAGLLVWNNTLNLVVVVFDDGTAASGSAPVKATVIPLASPLANGFSIKDTTFKGRVQIYAAAAPTGNYSIIAKED